MDFVLSLDERPYVPVYRSLSDALRKAILEGRLKSGQSLPSVRDLASMLKMSRSTVLRAFEDLQSQGYVESARGIGTIVCKRLPGEIPESSLLKAQVESPETSKAIDFSDYGKRLLSIADLEKREEQHLPQVNYGGPPLNLTPLSQWKHMLQRHCRLKDLSLLAYSVEPFGYPPLREAMAAYLRRARAVHCSSDQVIVFSGREARFDLICRVLLNPGDCVAVENPGFPSFRHRLASHGARIIPIPVDEHGINVAALEASKEKIKFVCVTPSHHDPTGAVLSEERRQQLLKWAYRTGAFIVEDDFDSEYRYGGRPLPSIQGLDQGDCVLHLHCFWKVLFPVVRLGFMIVPKCLSQVIQLAKEKIERDPPLIDQFALTDLINDGYIERHIKRTHEIYARRRQAIIYALSRFMADRAELLSSITGTDVLVRLKTKMDTNEVLKLAANCGLSMASTNSFYVGPHVENEYLIAFGPMDEEITAASVREFASRLS